MQIHALNEGLVLGFISRLFGDGFTSGDLRFEADSKRVVSRDVDTILDFLDENQDSYCALTTEADETVGFVIELFEGENADNLPLSPTYTVIKGGTRSAIWLFDEFPTREEKEALSSLVEEFGDQLVLVPGVGGADYIAPIDDEDTVYHTVQDVIDAFSKDLDESPETLDDAVLSMPMCVGISSKGASTRPGTWKNWDARFGDIVAKLSQHVEGSKDGPCILQGEVISGERRAKSIKANYLIGLDLDTGEDGEAIDKKVQELGYFCIRYTTHSHLKDVSEFNRDSVMKRMGLETDPTVEDAKRFLTEVKGYKPHVVRNLEILTNEHSAEGVMLRFKHAPMPKYRLIFPLAMPFVFADRGVSHKEAIEEWKERLGGLSQVLKVHLDESCVDPSRLYYLPRHPKGGEFEVKVINGKPVDVEVLPRVAVGRRRKLSDPFEAAAADIEGDGKALLTPGGTSMKRWAMGRSMGFEIREVLEDHAPERVREACASHSGVHIQCPFDGEHSNPGDPEDMGAFVVNGSEADSEGFRIHCMHDSCQGRDRLDFLHEMIVQEWFPEDVLHDDNYSAIIVDEDADDETARVVEQVAKEEKGFAAIRKRISSFDKDTSPDDVDAVLKLLAATGASEIKAGEVVRQVCDATGRPKTTIEKGYREHKKEFAVQQRKAKRKSKGTKKEIESDSKGRPCILPDEIGFRASVHAAWSAIKKTNAAEPRMFRYATGIARLREDDHGFMVAENLGMSEMRHEVNKVTTWMESRGDAPAKEVSAPTDVISDMISMTNHPLPMLNGIIATPVFTASEEILTEPGYDEESGLYLHMPEKLDIPAVSDVPSSEDVEKAKQLVLEEVLGDFPFDGKDDGMSSRAHGVCMMLQPFVREMIDGATPIYFVDKPTAGTGAGLFVDSTLLVSTGEKGTAQTEAKTEDEIRKTISSSLFEGAPYFWLDNINYKVDSSAIASATTSSKWTDRVLGSTKKITVPVRCMWIFSGNNVQVSNEIARRMVRVRLDSKLADPTTRKDFRHADLGRWIKDNRGDLIWACLTLVSAWLSNNKPKGDRVLASYENWSHVMGGILKNAGIGGFLDNIKELREESDEEGSALRDFVLAWWAEYKDSEVEVGNADDGTGLVGLVDENEIALPIRANTSHGRKVAMGRFIGKLRGRRFDVDFDGDEFTVKITQKTSASTGAKKMWSLELIEGEP